MKAKSQEEFKKRWVGIVEVKTGEKVAQFTSVDTYKDRDSGKDILKTFDNGTTVLKLNLTDLPKDAKRILKPGMKDARKFRIRLNQDGDELENIGPVSGMFSAHLDYIGPAKEGQDPAPYEKFFHKGQSDENSHLEFFASYKVTEGLFKGVDLPAYFLHYKFEGIPEGEEDEGMTRFDTVDTPQASQLHRLQDWAEVHGNILDDPIVWPEDGNILTTLQERAMDADREVSVYIEKGYIKSIQAKENYEEVDVDPDEVGTAVEDLDEVDEAFPVEEVKPVVIKSKVPARKPKKVAEVVEEAEDDL
jgi:hypothetical protein